MFERLGSINYRFRYAIVLGWVALAVGAVLFAPSLAASGETDQAGFLPASVDSVRARQALQAAFPGQMGTTSATLSFKRGAGLTPADHDYIATVATWIAGPDTPAVLRDAVTSVESAATRPELAEMLRSEDGTLELIAVNLDVGSVGKEAKAVVAALREHVTQAPQPGLETHVTGSASISSDYLTAIERGTDSTTTVTIILVVAMLLLIYRAPLAALVPLITIGAAFLVARGLLGTLAAAGWRISSLLDTFTIVLVFGVGTDYTIFLISRFREEVARTDWHVASMATVRRIGQVITASAATVVVGLGSMAFADFGMIQTTGPALAVSIVVTLVAGLTLAPALLAIFGHYLFWPMHARLARDTESHGVFAHIASAVSRRAGLVTAALVIALLAPTAMVGQMKTNFDVLAELPGDSDARAGFDDIAATLGRGRVVQATGIVEVGGDVDLLAPATLASLRDTTRELVATEGVAEVTSIVSPEGDGVVPDGMRPSKALTKMADGFSSDGGSSGDPAAILGSGVTSGLASARDYVGSLGVAFPDVGAGTAFATVTTDLAKASDQVARARDGAKVTTQLRSLSKALASGMSAAAAGEGGTSASASSVAIVGDYLDELAAAYPDVLRLGIYRRAVRDVATLGSKPTASAALDLADTLEALATRFDLRPGSTLFPESLASTATSKALRREIKETFGRLPGELSTLSAAFSSRRDDIFLPTSLAGSEGTAIRDAIDAFLTPDRTSTRFYVTTSDDPYSSAAFATVRRAQDVLAAAAPRFGASARALLGGATAELADVQTVLESDFSRVGIITVLGILLVLILLLRALVAPVYLVATVLLSFGTAIGLSAWFFQTVLGQPGVSFYLPLLVFVLLVALGSDYNIFLMSRVREESERTSIREGIRIASGRTGAVITSAGLILAGTFGSMATASLAVLFQVGVAVAVGVLIDTFVVRSILVPAITTLFGDRAWWPTGLGLSTLLGRGPAPAAPGTGTPPSAPAWTPSRRALAGIAMVVVLPMAIAGIFSWALGDPTGRLDGLQAAVVNEDGEIGGGLAGRLVGSRSNDSFGWVEADAAAARAGLATGRFVAVLTIPADFSASVDAIRADTTGTVHPATLRLATNDASSYALGTIARSISAAIASSTARTITADYIDGVLLVLTDTHDSLASLTGEAQDVATRSGDVVARLGDVAALGGRLVDGIDELASGASTARAGADKLATGTGALADGLDALGAGLGQLRSGIDASTQGAKSLAAGIDALSAGLDELAAQTKDLPAQATELSTGVSDLAGAADSVAGGASSLASNVVALDAATAGLPTDAAQLRDVAAVHASHVDAYTTSVSGLASACAGLGGSPALCAQLDLIAAGGAGVAAEAAGIKAATAQGATDAATLKDSISLLSAGGTQVAAGTAGVASGVHELAARVAPLTEGAPALAAGIATSAAGARDLASGANGLVTGLTAVGDGADPLVAGAASSATAAAQLASGTAASADGVSQLARALADAADGAKLFSSTATRLGVDLATVAGDAGALAGDLEDATTTVPAYRLDVRRALGAVAADPVSVETEEVSAVAGFGAGLAPYFTALGLWMGAMALFLVLPALELGATSRRRWWTGPLAAFVAAGTAAIVQALLTVGVLCAVLGAPVELVPEAVGIAALTAVAFVAIVQALVALLGRRGWFLALFLVVLQLVASGLPYPVETMPEVVRVVHPLLPMTYAVEALQATGGGSTLPAVAALGGWLLGGLTVTLLVAYRGVASRRPTPAMLPA